MALDARSDRKWPRRTTWGVYVIACILVATLLLRSSIGPAAAIGISLVLHAGLMAVPFVPGAEVGLSLMILYGPWIAPLVWLATTVGLMGAFVVGRHLSGLPRRTWPRPLRGAIARIRRHHTSAPLRRSIARHPAAALAIALNIPGNAVLGGGGGLALIAGLSGRPGLAGFAAAAALGTVPVPLGVWLGWVMLG